MRLPLQSSIYAFATVLACWLVTACTTMRIEESNFIRPDALSGRVTQTRLDQAALQAVVPNAKLTDQTATGDGGQVLNGVLMQRPDAVATVLYFGGNAFRLDDSAKSVATRLAACPLNILVFDYRGYGRSPGSPTVANMKQDALNLYDHARAQFGGHVFVHGHSLGSFVAAYVGQNRDVRGLVLEATATHAQDWANANVPWYGKPFVTLQIAPSLLDIDNTQTLASFGKPTLILAGGQDRVTPPELGRKVHDVLPGPAKQFLLMPDAGHNNLLSSPEVVSAYCGFIQKHKLH
jgi:uncharacterized protein